MKIYQSRLFEHKVRKFNKNQKSTLDDEIKKIISDPFIGREKKGDLKGVFVHKFKIKTDMQELSFNDLKGQVCVITGGAGVIGSSIAKGLASVGVKLAILDLNEEMAVKVAKEISEETGATVKGYKANVFYFSLSFALFQNNKVYYKEQQETKQTY